jgi:RNA polymerase sigma-70 factor, ECF subfamily
VDLQAATGGDLAAVTGDAELLALRAGEGAPFEALVRAQTGRLLAVARRFLRHEEDAREAVQETFLSAFRSRHRFAGECRVSTWLHRILVNICLMRLRARRRRPEVEIEEWLPRYLPDGHHIAALVDWSEAAHTSVEREETRALVRRCIEQLPDGYRVVLLMRDVEGLAVDEIASLLECTRNAVSIRLHRARQALRTLLAPYFGEGRSL